jgi:hypothetical protein
MWYCDMLIHEIFWYMWYWNIVIMWYCDICDMCDIVICDIVIYVIYVWYEMLWYVIWVFLILWYEIVMNWMKRLWCLGNAHSQFELSVYIFFQIYRQPRRIFRRKYLLPTDYPSAISFPDGLSVGNIFFLQNNPSGISIPDGLSVGNRYSRRNIRQEYLFPTDNSVGKTIFPTDNPSGIRISDG